jgi:hypothetical protein
MGGDHVKGGCEECAFFLDFEEEWWDDAPAVTNQQMTITASHLATATIRSTGPSFRLYKCGNTWCCPSDAGSDWVCPSVSANNIPEEHPAPSFITIHNREGTEMKVQVGQTVHVIRERRASCSAAVITAIPTFKDKAHPDRAPEPDEELGTINVTYFTGGGDQVDYEPDRPMPRTWHTLEECDFDQVELNLQGD